MSLRTLHGWIRSMLASAVLTAMILGCGGEGEDATDTEETAIVGAIVPLTGPAGDLGQLARRGFEVAEATLPVRVPVQDSQSDPRGGVNAFQSLTAQQGGELRAVVSFMSSVGNAIAPSAEDLQIVNIHIASAPDLTEGREFAFRWYITTDAQMGRLVDYLAAEGLAASRVSFLYINDDYGRESLRAFTARLRDETENPELMSESYGAGQSDFRSLVAQVRSFNPDVVAVVGYSSSLGILLRQLAEQRVEAKLIGDDAVSYPDVLKAAGETAEGMVFPGLPLERARETGTFFREHEQMYEEEPNDFAIFAYGATSMLQECMSRENYRGSQDLVRCLEGSEFQTPLGAVRFGDDHAGSVPLVMKQIQNGEVTAMADTIN